MQVASGVPRPSTPPIPLAGPAIEAQSVSSQQFTAAAAQETAARKGDGTMVVQHNGFVSHSAN